MLHLQPTMSNRHFALLLLPAFSSSALINQANTFSKCSNEKNLNRKFALRVTGSVAYIQLGV